MTTEFTTLAVLPLRDVVVYPHMVIPLFVGREKSIKALESAMEDAKQILLVAQRSAADDDPSTDDIHEVGTVSNILQLLKLPDGTIKVLVEGVKRARTLEFVGTDEFFSARIQDLEPEPITDREAEVLTRSLMGQFDQYVKSSRRCPASMIRLDSQTRSPRTCRSRFRTNRTSSNS